MHNHASAIARARVLIAQAKRAGARSYMAGARSYMARFKAMSIAGWAVVLRRDAGTLRQAPTAKGKRGQQEG